MEADSALEGAVLKLVIDAIRKAFPIIDGRWVHLMACVGAAVMTLMLHYGSANAMFGRGVLVALAAIGANEVSRKPAE